MSQTLPGYARLIATGRIERDPAQAAAAERLARLAAALADYSPGRRSLFRRAPTPPRGVYLWGGVGVGKSLLMDLFFEDAPIEAKRRVHFHAFMQEIHEFIGQWRKLSEQQKRDHPDRLRAAELDDPIPHAAHAVFRRAHLLCFDELQVTDAADAMILGRLFEHLFELGTVIATTSNRHPDDLYKDGLNRRLFLPAIALLKDRLDVVELVGAKDYRLDRLQREAVYFTPLDAAAEAAMDRAFAGMTAEGTPAPAELEVGSRRVAIPCAARGVARGSFDHWCRTPFGPRDYLLLANSYPVLLVDRIPRLGPDDRNEARRFVTLVDALYESRVKLVCSAAAPPNELYERGDGSFEFARTASRLFEMQSTEYLALAHVEVQST
jgi:cell division protein ZapE